MKCHSGRTGAGLTRTGVSCTGVRLFRAKLWRKISPVACSRVSFQTMLTVPLGGLTAMRGKSCIGKRL